jgi:hypothetical protein
MPLRHAGGVDGGGRVMAMVIFHAPDERYCAADDPWHAMDHSWMQRFLPAGYAERQERCIGATAGDFGRCQSVTDWREWHPDCEGKHYGYIQTRVVDVEPCATIFLSQRLISSACRDGDGDGWDHVDEWLRRSHEHGSGHYAICLEEMTPAF